MNFKKLILTLLIAWIFGITVVYSNYVKSIEAKVVWILSSNIYLNSSYLNSSVIALKSKDDISKNIFSWFCSSQTNFLYVKDDIYFYSLSINDKNCNDWNFYFLDNKSKRIDWVKLNFNMINNFEVYNKYLDYDSSNLNKLLEKQKEILKKYYEYNLYQVLNINLDVVKKSRLYAESLFEYNVIMNILEKRNWKYSLPVEWYNLSTRHTKLPNSARPYRASYTDWVHNWWDIDAPYWTSVRSIDDWIILKVVRWFKFSDLNNVNYNKNLTDDEKRVNLDILRWNQVWIKTMKGDVIFYAHLSELDNNIKVWDFVVKNQYIWKIWISWVPDKDYSDYHLHFELKQNPFNIDMVWKYELIDYMRWDWYFKWKTDKFILENQYNIFQKN